MVSGIQSKSKMQYSFKEAVQINANLQDNIHYTICMKIQAVHFHHSIFSWN